MSVAGDYRFRRRRLIAQRTVRSDGIAFLSPVLDQHPGFEEPGYPEALKRLPCRPRGELGPVVGPLSTPYVFRYPPNDEEVRLPHHVR